MRVVLLPGDGVGREVTAEVAKVLEVSSGACGFELEVREFPCGGQYYLETGTEWPDEAFDVCRSWADVIFLGAVGWPGATLDSGDPAGKSVLFGLRFGLDLYANIRPSRLLPKVLHRIHSRHQAIWKPEEVDLVIFRENTEGLYAPFHGTLSRGGTSEIAVDSRVITRRGAERIIEAAFREAELRGRTSGRGPHLTCVDKSNVLDGCRLFREVFHEKSKEHRDVATDERYIDAFCQALMWEPGSFDVVVTPNLFGDIASDVAAVLAGGLGMAPSAEAGDTQALFEPVHGSAPALAGTGRANPIAAVLSAAMMLEWYGRTCKQTNKKGGEGAAAARLRTAVERLVSEGQTLPEELGGTALCGAVGDELCRLVQSEG